MQGFIDIHSHILPRLDDGSDSLEQTRRMAKIATEEGIRAIITTPHYQEGRMMTPYSSMEERRKSIQQDPELQQYSIEYYPGCEIYYSHESIKQLNNKQIPTLAGSKYVLVEFSPMVELRYMKTALQEFLFEGYLPILAHTERYQYLIKDMDLIEELVGLGVYIQVNAMSVTGDTGRAMKKITKKLLKRGLVHFVATDSHSDRKRSPRLKKCAKYITRKFGEEYTRELLIVNPGKILSNEYI